MKALIILMFASMLVSCQKEQCHVCTLKKYNTGQFTGESSTTICGMSDAEAKKYQQDHSTTIDQGMGQYYMEKTTCIAK